MFDVADPSIRAALTDVQNTNSANTDAQNANSANEALTTVANSWNQLGVGNEIPQSASYAWHIANGVLVTRASAGGKRG